MLKSSTHGSLQNGVLGIDNKLERNTINQWTQICTRLWKSHRVNLPQNKTMVHCATMIKKTPNRIWKKWCCHLNHYCFGVVRG